MRWPSPTLYQRRLGELERIGAAGELERQSDILVRRHGRNEVESLKDDADMVAPQARPVVVAHRPMIIADDLDLAGRRALKPACNHHQARLAGTGRPDHRRNLAGRDVERDATQDIDRAGIARHVEMHVGQANDRK
jgi:hypothetical protein